MPAPYDYTLGQVPNPAQSFLQGIQTVDALRQREQQIADAEKARKAQEAFRTMQTEYWNTPNPTLQQTMRLASMLPKDQAEMLFKGVEAQDKAKTQANIALGGQVLSSLLAGDKNTALTKLRERETASTNSGDQAGAQQWGALAKQIEIAKPEESFKIFAPFMAASGEEGRKMMEAVYAAQKQPLEQRKATAEAAEAERKAKGEPSDQFEILTPKQASSFGLPPGTYQRDKTNGKITSIGSGGVTVNMPSQVQVGTIPQGYQLTYDAQGRPVSMSPIPGSQAARDVAAEAEKAQASAASAVTSSNIVLSEADRLQDLIKKESFFKPVTGVGGAIVREKGGVLASGSAAVTAQKTLDTIKANIGFDRLTQMRKESPTGGALGNITEKELAFLQSVLGSLDLNQDKKILSQNVNRIKEIYTEILRKASAYPNAAKYGFDSSAATTKPTSSRNIVVEY